VAQAQQVARIAEKAGIQRESLYRALSMEGNPTLETLHSVLGALGLRMEIAVQSAASAGGISGPPPRKPQSNVLEQRRRKATTKKS
jgi:transcriptional regulator with XRE-family HTH domain